MKCIGRSRRDAGASLVNVLVGMVLAVVVITIGVGIMRQVNKTDENVVTGTQVQRELQNAQSTLYRDVNDGISLRIADERELAFTVIRDGTCRVRWFHVQDDNLVVEEQFYETDVCDGPTETRVEHLVTGIQDGPIFSYEDERQRQLGTPITHFPAVRLIEWDLRPSAQTGKTMPISSGAAFDHKAERRGSGVAQVQARAPYLTVVTPTVGVDAPALAWTDYTPSITTLWTVWRTVTFPDHPDDGQQVAVASLPAATTTWTDTDLPQGASAVYRVQATVTTGQTAPPSNPVVTGVRPAAPVVTVTGQAQSIKLSWAAVAGADRYDIYRDGSLIANVGDVTTHTDNLTYGRAHNYTVVAGNRWESRWTTGSDAGRVATGTAASKSFPGGYQRRHSSQVGGYTAPAAPTITATPNTDASTTVARTYAGWTGPGPTSGRDRGWELQRAPLSGNFAQIGGGELTAASYKHTGRTLGSTDRYRARACNSSGCGPWSSTASALQRPPTPTSCTIDQITTRSMRVTINAASSESSYTSYEITASPTGGTNLGQSTANQRTIDNLTHNTNHTFTVRAKNGSPANSGWSDTKTCSAKTNKLVAKLGEITKTTRAVTIMGTSTSGGLQISGGNARKVWIERAGEEIKSWTSVSSNRTYDKLKDNTKYKIFVSNSDGYNTVSDNTEVRTEDLKISLGTITTTTRAITIKGSGSSDGITFNGGDERYVEIVGVKSWNPGVKSDKTYDKLVHDTTYTVRVHNTDGYNSTSASRKVTTKKLSAGTAPTCVATVNKSTAPGSITISGGDQVKLGSSGTVYAAPRTYTGLSAGTYTGYSRKSVSDGYNTVYTAWDSCPARTISNPDTGWTTTKPTLSCTPVPTESDLRQTVTNNYGMDYFVPPAGGWNWLYRLNGETAYWGIYLERRDNRAVELKSGLYTCGIGV